MKQDQPSILVDQEDRDRFIGETGENFSVNAPAGVGKTTAIVERIVKIALDDQHRENPILPRLALVTYTKKAANEMEERARKRLLQEDVNGDALIHFGQAFFGTIHSFCLDLLTRFGYLVGLPTTFELAEDEDALWLEFVRSQDEVLSVIPESVRADYVRHASLNKALQFTAGFKPVAPVERSVRPCPRIDLSPLIEFESKSARAAASIEEGKHMALQWQKAYSAGEESLPIPDFSKGGKAFLALWQACFQPLREWLGEVTLLFAEGVSRVYREYRMEHGILTFDDMVSLAVELLQDPVAGQAIRKEGYCIILDEAQDTDREQFEVLLGAACPEESTVFMMDSNTVVPAPGRFSMVGDPQQSIFSARADLPTYLKIHDTLVERSGASGLTFRVTMRCDEAVVDTVNSFFPEILKCPNDASEQVNFVRLEARPWAKVGKVSKVPLQLPDDFKPSRSQSVSDRAEAQAIVDWLADKTPSDLGIENWEGLAVLAPRNDWLATLSGALEKAGFLTQVHSRKDIFGDNPAFAWLTALVSVIAEPSDSFEIVGVLREIFGLSDDRIAWFVESWEPDWNQRDVFMHPIHLLDISNREGPVADALNRLVALRIAVEELPLRDAVNRVVVELELRERLAVIPGIVSEDWEPMLDALLLETAMAEEQGKDLRSWSKRLKQRFEDRTSESTPLPGHIQLFSCHKSKGLEWPVVLLPFFFRSISKRSQRYPKYLPVAEPVVVYDKHHRFQAEEAVLDQRVKDENERLLYVAMTRAANRLLIVDDRSFYKDNAGSFADCFKVLAGQSNYVLWEHLPSFEKEPVSVSDACTENLNTNEDSASVTSLPPSIDEMWLNAVVAKGQDFIRRVIPSSLANHEAFERRHERDEEDAHSEPIFPEMSETVSRSGTGADYGNWWHDSMEHLPWSGSVNDWAAFMQRRFELSPDPQRGHIEWKLFLQSELAEWLQITGLTVRTELPFLWKNHKNEALDGFIDMVAFDEEKQHWRVIDWKTDRIEKDPAQELIESYGPQVSAYVEAVEAICGGSGSVEGVLYSTRTGILVAL